MLPKGGGMFKHLFKGLGKIISAPFKAVKSAVGLPLNLLKSAPSILKGAGSSLTDLLGKLVPIAAGAAPLLGAAVPGLGPMLGMLGPALGSLGGHQKMLAQTIPHLSQQLTAGTPYLPSQWPLGQISKGLVPGFGG